MTVVVEPAGLDATTAIWLQNSCTDINTLFEALFAIPTVGGTASLVEFRAAYRDYYSSLADTLLEMTGRMAVLDPPTIDGGQALHDGYLTYLIGLADVSGSGAIAIDEAPDAQTIADIVDQIEFETDQLGQADYGLADFQGAELQALMAQVPACQTLLAAWAISEIPTYPGELSRRGLSSPPLYLRLVPAVDCLLSGRGVLVERPDKSPKRR